MTDLEQVMFRYTHFTERFQVDERTAHFNECWHMWADNRLTLELSRTQVLYLRKYLRSLGLYEWDDYIFRHGKEIRFKEASDLAMVKLTGLDI